jgi:hypothetical protein
MISRNEKSGAWLFGPTSDFLWGAGVAYAAVFVLLVANGAGVMSVAPPWLTMFLVVLVSMPHYGATLLRVYQSGEDGKVYARFSTWTAVALSLLFLWGVRDAWVGSILFTLYFTWSPWHYTSQNYGVTLMFLGRRGIILDPHTKLLLRASFVLSFVITFFFIHGHSTFTPFRGAQVQFLSLNFLAVPSDVVIFVCLLGYAAASFFAVAAIVRKGARQLGPALMLMATQALWFVVPAVIKNWFPYGGGAIFAPGYENYAFTWVALGHAAQYLWITAYFAKASGRATSVAPFYFKTLMAGSAIWAVPLLLFAPGLLGKLPYDWGLASVTAAAINLHHFIVDGAVWKLRKAPVGRILLSSGSRLSPSGIPSSGTSWPLAAAGVLSVAVLLFSTVEEEFGFARSLSQQNVQRAEVAVERLAVVGRDSPSLRLQVASLAMRADELEKAIYHLEAGIRVFPTATGWIRLGQARASSGDSQRAIQAFENALVLDPHSETARMSLALSCAGAGERERARSLLQQPVGAETLESHKLREQLMELLGS